VCSAVGWLVAILGAACNGPSSHSLAGQSTTRETPPGASERAASGAARPGPDVARQNSAEGVRPKAAEVAGARPLPTFEHLGYARPVAQVLACGPLGFVRLIEQGFEVYSYRNLTRTARYEDGAFTHVTEQPGYSYLLVGAGPSLLYYQANPRLTVLGHLPALGPFTIWADPQARERLWVHYLKDDAVHHFELPRDSERAGELLGSLALPNFDGNLLARLTAGQWIYAAYSESGGADPFAGGPAAGKQLRLVDGARTAWLGGFPAQSEAAAAGSGVGVWLLSMRGALAFELSPLDRLVPNGAIDLASEPWVAVTEGGRLAVIGQEVKARTRLWTLQVVETGKTRALLPLSFDDAADVRSASRRALCLVPGRPWVVVGGPNELRVIDYTTGAELLAR
jgi:hypothetical protein